MSIKSILGAAAAVVFLSGCASTKQYVHFPNQGVGLEDPAKARIYVARPSSFGCAVSMKVSDGDTLIGKTGGKGYLCWERNPGKMIVKGKAENTDTVSVDVEKGYVYYFEQTPCMGIMMARNRLEQVDGERGKNIVAKCKQPQLVN